jgi:hypothetical protein
MKKTLIYFCFLCALAFALPLGTWPAEIWILSPLPDTQVTSGSTIEINVAMSQDITSVRLFTPGQDLAVQAFPFFLDIPAQQVGPFPILLIGTNEQGQISLSAVTIEAVPDARLEGIAVEPKEAVLIIPGETLQLKVTGRYSDGVPRDLTRLSRYAVDSPPCFYVSHAGAVQGLKEGKGCLYISYKGLEETAGFEVREAEGLRLPLILDPPILSSPLEIMRLRLSSSTELSVQDLMSDSLLLNRMLELKPLLETLEDKDQDGLEELVIKLSPEEMRLIAGTGPTTPFFITGKVADGRLVWALDEAPKDIKTTDLPCIRLEKVKGQLVWSKREPGRLTIRGKALLPVGITRDAFQPMAGVKLTLAGQETPFVFNLSPIILEQKKIWRGKDALWIPLIIKLFKLTWTKNRAEFVVDVLLPNELKAKEVFPDMKVELTFFARQDMPALSFSGSAEMTFKTSGSTWTAE